MKTFTTLYPYCENIHLTKDLGQIPYFMYATYGYQSKIATYQISQSYSNIHTEVEGLQIDFIKNSGQISFLEKGVLQYIFRQARKTDVLNLFHFSKQSFVYGILYKLLNPKGMLFLKIDGYNETFAEGTRIIHSRKKLKNFVLRFFEKIFLKKVDIISIENTEGVRLVKLMYPEMASKVIYFPVGVNDLFLKKHFEHRLNGFDKKENLILTTGRIGEKIKNHEMILKALVKMDLKDWKMVFVGPVNPVFMAYFDSLAVNHPQLKEAVIFTGEITDRITLYEWYNRSKLFCMTSWNESFSLSIAEAFYFGNYIIGTEGVMSMKDITNNQTYGAILEPDDDEALSVVLQKAIDDQTQIKTLFPESIQYAHQHFVWSTIIHRIEERIQQKH